MKLQQAKRDPKRNKAWRAAIKSGRAAKRAAAWACNPARDGDKASKRK